MIPKVNKKTPVERAARWMQALNIIITVFNVLLLPITCGYLLNLFGIGKK